MTLTTGAKRVAIIVISAWMAGSALGGSAIGADRSRSARAHTSAARAYFNLEKYREAIAEYERAYMDKQDPAYFFEIAECHRLLSNVPEAERFYGRFIQDAPAGHANRPAAEAQTEDGSGKHIDIAGKAFLVVRFEPAATADLSSEKLDVTYKGPRTFRPTGTTHVKQVTKIGDFEGVLTWTIGLSQ